ncbi:hypothetical protein FB45DRAFT_1039722 [Roridomyces roridus]|uniref:MYND-type domain-containing protein n=1 Tax=Roridomyces roridus TaxID=1738132 RepID=A0AAD7FAJ6_9AGAR|nr:hypothetical protein FB45DRAFT_1039722 [Roridomyces roridus]
MGGKGGARHICSFSFSKDDGHSVRPKNREYLHKRAANEVKLIGHVLHYVLRSFLGLPVELVKGFGKVEAKKRVELEREALKVLYSQRKQQCSNCRKLNETGTKYSRCKRCWDDMERETLYCSPACQKADWKAGHKATCGQPLKLEDIGPATPERRDTQQTPPRGPPVPSSRSVSQLMYQALRTNGPLDYDYFIWTAQIPIYFSFKYKPVQVAVLAARTKALASGDRAAVANLAHILLLAAEREPRARSFGLTEEILVKQFKHEYEFHDLQRELDEMRARMASDSLRRPPLLVDAGFTADEWEQCQKAWDKDGLAEIGTVAIPPQLAETARRRGVF